MRLRQVAVISSDLNENLRHWTEVLGLQAAYRDPHIHHYGLRNVVLPVGDGFLEIVEPIREGVSAARFLKRSGGDAGYMLILQTDDARRDEFRAIERGVRVVDRIDRPDYYCAHFHPADFGGVLVSFDQQLTELDYLKSDGDWMPAGKDWRNYSDSLVLEMNSVTISTEDPRALCEKWMPLLAGYAESNCIRLEKGEVQFTRKAVGAGTRISGLGLRVRNCEQVLTACRKVGIETDERGFHLAGLRFSLTE